MQELSSKLFENAVQQINKLPGIGYKTSLRLALFLLKQPKEEVALFTQAIDQMRENILFCSHCYNISDTFLCQICSDKQRNAAQICVVRDIRDVIAIENTLAYKGLYHVLGGVISPMDGVGIQNLNINALFERIQNTQYQEIILALPATTEGETTAFYISKNIRNIQPDIHITTIARGVSIGNELENTDEITLTRSIINRIVFEPTPI
ncbi:MAG: recombination mediator RecR [Bacteroidales bacterium]|jgi:recombination protein RecR|nr:recombination mediator RecR [Bacteroidales bacterium]